MAASYTFGEYGGTSTEKPCRTCMDFKSWTKLQKKVLNKDATPESNSNKSSDDHSREDLQCPLDKDELGRNTWSFLHTMAAYYPDTPNKEQQTDVKQFFSAFSRLYPCSFCAKDLQEVLKVSPPPTQSQEQLSQWLCNVHNGVNERLGKPLFDCSRVNERWRDGWKDGSCDG